MIAVVAFGFILYRYDNHISTLEYMTGSSNSRLLISDLLDDISKRLQQSCTNYGYIFTDNPISELVIDDNMVQHNDRGPTATSNILFMASLYQCRPL